jgi:phosphohistidine phosphatase
LKLLTLIRHAKSSWKREDLTDFERPLNDRGERDAPRMGERLAAEGVRPERIVSSSAVRAEQTARKIAEALGLEPDVLVLERSLYLASPAGLLETVRGLDAGLEHAALVAHNPGITDFVNRLANVRIDNVPTCGIARLRLEIDRWSDAEEGCAELIDFDYPKRKRD